MKVVRLKENIVIEVIPDEARPVEDWYNKEFASQCVEAPDEVDQHWVYDRKNNKWLEPGSELPIESDPVETLINAVIS